MNELEKGYVHIDDNGDVQYVSYDTVGGGITMISLLILLTAFITNISTAITNNKWIILIPTLIAVIFRTLLYDKELPVYKKLLNIFADTTKTICMYGVLLIVLDKIANAHWLDRLFFAAFYGAILLAVYLILNKFVFNILRTCQMCLLHLVASLLVAVVSIFLYCGHSWYWKGSDDKVFLNTASIVKVDQRIEGTVELPEKINTYTVKAIGKNAFSSNKKITDIKLPNSIQTIKESAFSSCKSLKSIVIPLSVTTIESYAFYNAPALTDIYYEGTETEWNKIVIQDNDISNINIHFNSQL